MYKNKAGEFSLGERKLATHALKKSAIATVLAILTEPYECFLQYYGM